MRLRPSTSASHSAAIMTYDGNMLQNAYNVVWHFFTNPTTRENFSHWEQIARGLLAEFRTASTRYPGDAWFEDLIADLKQASPEFCHWWPHHEASNLIDGAKIIEHPVLGHLEFRHLTLHVFSDPDIRVTAHIPDAQTRAKLQRFRTAEERTRGQA